MTVTARPAELRVGAPAPDFTLPSTAGTDVTLSTFRGRAHVLIAFFPLAFTSTCTAENCAFSEDYDAFERAGTSVLPVSVDSVPTLREYKAKYNEYPAYECDHAYFDIESYRVAVEKAYATTKKWPSKAFVEYEYAGKDDAVTEVKRCFQYCKDALG